MSYYPLPRRKVFSFLAEKDPFLLLETTRPGKEDFRSYLFFDPVDRLEISCRGDFRSFFDRVEVLLKQGYYLAGFFSYEAGLGMEEVLKPLITSRTDSFPAARLYCFRPPIIFDHRTGLFEPALPGRLTAASPGRYSLQDLKLNVEEAEYGRNIRRIRQLIAAGQTYQVNYTVRCRFRFRGSPLKLYEDLCRKQSVAYAALIRDNGSSLLSLSPELFFRREGDRLTVRPMKGTIGRGRDPGEDRLQARKLRQSIKNRSENLMIVDLLRNDLGRISVPGSVKADALFDIEKYETVFQMTSAISGQLATESYYDIFRALFPSGSVTGAPKIRTMQIINRLERDARRVYTGAIGMFRPDGGAVFNVAIRTLLINGNDGEMGIGGGIVYDSQSADEYEECRLKALFFTRGARGFRLLETFGWNDSDGYYLLDYHLRRLHRSAQYFGFRFQKASINRALDEETGGFDRSRAYRVRLLLGADGGVKVQSAPLSGLPSGEARRVRLSRARVDVANPFLYHKTTNRAFYTRQLNRARQAGLYDFILQNRQGEITEGTFSNVFVRRNGRLYTPPVRCGLLPGVLRASLLDRGEVREKVLRRPDLEDARAVYLGNSVRGLVKVDCEMKKKRCGTE